MERSRRAYVERFLRVRETFPRGPDGTADMQPFHGDPRSAVERMTRTFPRRTAFPIERHAHRSTTHRHQYVSVLNAGDNNVARTGGTGTNP